MTTSSVSPTASSASTPGTGLGEIPLQPPAWSRVTRRLFGHRGLAIGLIVVGLAILIAIFAPLLAPHDPYHQDVANRMVPPVWHDKGSWEHVLGTDKLGRDTLSRLLFGTRISLTIGLVVALISGVIGTTLGVLAGYFGG
ncbi:ABC transporter permease, partial [Salinicola salarius]|uniref:ABC transporter permease n=1 Tax=Salinicola salarius TaxID=430457 RepID=UPI00350E4515